ncbi:hypothetical protein R3P38DRAFT_2807479 [Favolaschia claudopus]|uniref:Uncharacterized protein n=1 Tax=Favolaschia claudopus TaxID=2862362 RepID=A0AAV9ZHN5_9AGAR
MPDLLYYTLVVCLVLSNLNRIIWAVKTIYEYLTRPRAPQLVPYFDENGKFYSIFFSRRSNIQTGFSGNLIGMVRVPVDALERLRGNDRSPATEIPAIDNSNAPASTATTPDNSAAARRKSKSNLTDEMNDLPPAAGPLFGMEGNLIGFMSRKNGMAQLTTRSGSLLHLFLEKKMVVVREKCQGLAALDLMLTELWDVRHGIATLMNFKKNHTVWIEDHPPLFQRIAPSQFLPSPAISVVLRSKKRARKGLIASKPGVTIVSPRKLRSGSILR